MKKCILCGEILVKGESCHLHLDTVCIDCENEVDELSDITLKVQGITQETIEDTLRDDTDERLLYCNTCDEGTPYKDMGLVYSQYCCISCADGMGEPLKSRGCIA